MWVTLVDYIRCKLVLLWSYNLGKIESRNWNQNKFAINLYTTVCYKKQAVPIFIKTFLFPHKTAYLSNDSHDVYKNADGNPKLDKTMKIDFWELKTTNNSRRLN